MENESIRFDNRHRNCIQAYENMVMVTKASDSDLFFGLKVYVFSAFNASSFSEVFVT